MTLAAEDEFWQVDPDRDNTAVRRIEKLPPRHVGRSESPGPRDSPNPRADAGRVSGTPVARPPENIPKVPAVSSRAPSPAGNRGWAPRAGYRMVNGKEVPVCWNCDEAGHLQASCRHPRREWGPVNNFNKGGFKGAPKGGGSVTGRGYRGGVDMYLGRGKGDGKNEKGGKGQY